LEILIVEKKNVKLTNITRLRNQHMTRICMLLLVINDILTKD